MRQAVQLGLSPVESKALQLLSTYSSCKTCQTYEYLCLWIGHSKTLYPEHMRQASLFSKEHTMAAIWRSRAISSSSWAAVILGLFSFNSALLPALVSRSLLRRCNACWSTCSKI